MSATVSTEWNRRNRAVVCGGRIAAPAEERVVHRRTVKLLCRVPPWTMWPEAAWGEARLPWTNPVPGKVCGKPAPISSPYRQADGARLAEESEATVVPGRSRRACRSAAGREREPRTECQWRPPEQVDATPVRRRNVGPLAPNDGAGDRPTSAASLSADRSPAACWLTSQPTPARSGSIKAGTAHAACRWSCMANSAHGRRPHPPILAT